ncbi:hypothetical protein KY284_029821 [Solanum tuberosum]|nr:hypothetical protein KY284_029821 [Solanum tuberosum]
MEAGQHALLPKPYISYAETLKPTTISVKPLHVKPISYLHGEPRVMWEHEEIDQMIVNENLEYAVVGKFSYGWPEIQELRKLIPKQCELKGECKIGLLSKMHILIRATLLEDYVHLLSKPVFYITQKNWSFPMRTLKWDPMFDPEEETTTTIAWISFPSLPPNFFGRETVFSLAAAVGKPLQVDREPRNQTRPSCGRVKVEVDLLGEFPKRINICMKKTNGEVMEKWVRIKYDYVPKYCKTCMLQGHDEQQCFVEHPELYPKKEKKNVEADDREERGKTQKTNEANQDEEKDNLEKRIAIQQKEKTNKFEESKFKRGGWRKQPEKVWAKVDIPTGNKFGALENDAKEGEATECSKRIENQAFDKLITQVTKETSKEWVEGSFGI